MAYTQYQRGAFIAELAQALNDPTHVYWAADELNRALNEALLYWGALTSYWTTSSQFNTQAGTVFYDLSAQFPTQRSRAYTLGNLMREIQYALFEPAMGVTGNGVGATTQFTLPQITNALIRRRNQFVTDSRIPYSMSTVIAPSPPTASMTIDNAIALISRIGWTDNTTGVRYFLNRTDTWAAKAHNPVWNLKAGRPYGFSQVESMPGTLLLIPPSSVPCSLSILSVNTADLPVNDSTSLLIPDEFSLAVKWGALYEILSTNSQGYDPIRTKYAMERYIAAVQMAEAHRSILEVRRDNTPLSLTTIAELDSAKPTWATGNGQPVLAACAYDILTLYRVPDRPYQMTCYLSQTAPLPASDSDYIQVGKEELGYLMDYCRHILQFKLGGVEFVQSMPLHDSFLRGAAQRSKFVSAKAKYLAPLFNQSRLEEQASPAA